MTEAAANADMMARSSKAFLVHNVAKGSAGPFDSKRFAMGHNATRFSKWYSTETQYHVQYTYRYEPWIITDRRAVPWHDVRFRGYGQNKIVHVAHVNASGFNFVVHPRAFIVHRAHPQTAARLQLIDDMKGYNQAVKMNKEAVTNTVYGHSKALFDAAKVQMDSGSFDPVLDPGTLHCMKVLSWWK
eukprot:CAMPEP_0202906838 /NCGR_PEP_ID=MMETSP1392-20130828/40458_1 /ASSEMBLY_ACC=CAM_ASM_000868 /TAXON_ID=225041 /ORGANISM="Chlamydomonas chlamydogama, Strain SAG 11-48b" /LENGTH=185 /DNA_ID=CAMNT_0049595503 /DNA_START=44 /DNA_END=601 /DNA_ORIENTATION=-